MIGVSHDSRFVALQSEALTIDGTSVGAFKPDFLSLRVVEGGFIQAVVLRFAETQTLPPGASSLSRAAYVLEADPAPGDTRIRLTDSLHIDGETQPRPITLTSAGRGVRPSTLQDAVIRKRSGPLFVRGDTNGDSILNITDPIVVLGFLFLGSPSDLPCRDAADVNDNGDLEISDAVRLLGLLFSYADSYPPDPFPGCGEDPSEDTLGCSSYAPCGSTDQPSP